MTDRKFTVSIIIIILSAVFAVFLYADRLIHGPLKNGYTAVAFVFSDNQVLGASLSAQQLGIEVTNAEEADLEYKITFSAEEIKEETEKKISSRNTETIKPTDEFISQLKSAKQNNFTYAVEIRWEKGQQKIYKKITLQ